MQNSQNGSFVLGINKPKINKNSKYLVPVQRRIIADSIGVFALNFGQDLLLLQSTELIRILLDFSCSISVLLCYFAKNEKWATFTHWISFTGPLCHEINSTSGKNSYTLKAKKKKSHTWGTVPFTMRFIPHGFSSLRYSRRPLSWWKSQIKEM